MELEIVKENLPDVYLNQEIEDVEADFHQIKDNIKDLIERGFDTLDTMKEVFEDTEHPRAAEVLAQTLKTVSEMNRDLMGLHRSRQIIKKDILGEGTNSSPAIEHQHNQQNIYVGSSADLQKLLKGE